MVKTYFYESPPSPPKITAPKHTTKILVAGSRDMSQEMHDITKKCILDISLRDSCEVIVGEAGGVDKVAIEECLRLGVKHTVYAPVGYKPRIESDYIQFVGDNGYWSRTAAVVDMSDEGYFIWDGQSRGTIGGYSRMKKQGKTVRLWTVTDIDGNISVKYEEQL